MPRKSAVVMPPSTDPAEPLLAPDEPPAYMDLITAGDSNFLIVVDHASARIPRALGNLGLPASELRRHIAWDIGSLAVARQVAATLNARLVAQNYSRLVIDCNRDPGVSTSIPHISEHVEIPGNAGLSAQEALRRRREIFDPYHDHLHAVLEQRQAAGRSTIVVAQHSMTDIFKGVRREMHAAVLYNRDHRFARLVRDGLRREPQLLIAENEPYVVSDESDFTIPHHAEDRGLPYVAIEIRQDLLADELGQAEWARRIAGALRTAEDIFLETRP
jgi:predicted N-formylglutamate amidohydrolase